MCFFGACGPEPKRYPLLASGFGAPLGPAAGASADERKACGVPNVLTYVQFGARSAYDNATLLQGTMPLARDAR
jgi:hypothetical protein